MQPSISLPGPAGFEALRQAAWRLQWGHRTRHASPLMNRRWRLWLGFALLVAPLFLPAVQWRLIGWVRAEAFYQGRPTSYWDRELRQGTMLRGVGCGERCVPFMTFQPPEPTLLEKWLKQYLDWDVDPGPSLDADSEAIPVLLALLTSDHEIVRILAMEKLGKVGPEALAPFPACRSWHKRPRVFGNIATPSRPWNASIPPRLHRCRNGTPARSRGGNVVSSAGQSSMSGRVSLTASVVPAQPSNPPTRHFVRASHS